MKKPNVDIEWYEDGFSIEEQNQLRVAYLQAQPKIKITEKQKEDWKDKRISQLTTENAANEEYIKELETENQEQKKLIEEYEAKVQKYQLKYKEMADRYSRDVNAYFHSEEFSEKYTTKIAELEKQVKHLTDIRNELLYKLHHNADI